MSPVSSAFVGVLLLLAGTGCGEDPVAAAAAGTGAGGGGGGGGAAPVLDPALFDCTAPSVPDRVNQVPAGCATDPACTTRLVSGHRGVGGALGVIAPEDTVSAVRAAIALGIDFIETDPRPTKDGFLVNLHDPTVDRTTDGTGDAAAMTLAEIQALHIDASKFAGDFSCERVPTLEEILTAARGRVHVLVDANKTDRVDLLVGAIQSTDTLEWAIFDTDGVDKIDEALALEPALLTMIRVGDAAELDAELDHFAAHPPVIVELHGNAIPSELSPAVHARQNRVLVDTFGTDFAAGLDGDASVYGTIYDTGVDIAQSDRPELVLEYLGRAP